MNEFTSLTKGTIEDLVLDITDRLGNISSLVGLNARFSYRAKDATSWIVTDQAATVAGMKMFCLIDTTTLTPGKYELYAKFDAAPEHPVLGPFEFGVNA